MPESIESSKYVSHRTRMSGELDSRKYSHSTKFEWMSPIFVKLSFREVCGSELSGLHPFHNMTIIHSTTTTLRPHAQQKTAKY